MPWRVTSSRASTTFRGPVRKHPRPRGPRIVVRLRRGLSLPFPSAVTDPEPGTLRNLSRGQSRYPGHRCKNPGLEGAGIVSDDGVVVITSSSSSSSSSWTSSSSKTSSSSAFWPSYPPTHRQPEQPQGRRPEASCAKATPKLSTEAAHASAIVFLIEFISNSLSPSAPAHPAWTRLSLTCSKRMAQDFVSKASAEPYLSLHAVAMSTLPVSTALPN